MDKGPEAFRTISEVADDLDLPQHVLRFWETRFNQIKPLKRGGGRRYYRPDDIVLLRGIKHLLYGEGYTIKGVQRILRDQGPRYVISLGHSGEEEVESYNPPPPAPETYAPHRNQIASDNDTAAEREADAGDFNEFDESVSAPREEKIEPSFRFETKDDIRQPDDGLKASQTTLHDPDDSSRRRRLQLTLFELLECKEMLEKAR